MATLDEIAKSLRMQAQNGQGRPGQNGVIYTDKIIRLPGLQRLTVKLNYASDGHYSLVVYRGNNIRKQFAIFPEDAEELMTIANFLAKYAETLSKYVRYSVPSARTADYVELDIPQNGGNGGNMNRQAPMKRQQRQPANIQDEFDTE